MQGQLLFVMSAGNGAVRLRRAGSDAPGGRRGQLPHGDGTFFLSSNARADGAERRVITLKQTAPGSDGELVFKAGGGEAAFASQRWVTESPAERALAPPSIISLVSRTDGRCLDLQDDAYAMTDCRSDMVGEKQEVGESRMVSDALQLSAEVGSLRGAVAALRDENAELSGESAVSSREDAESEGGGQAEAALRAEVVELRAVAAEQQALLEAGRPEAAELAEGRRALRQAELEISRLSRSLVEHQHQLDTKDRRLRRAQAVADDMEADLEATQALAEERLAALEAARRETERLRAESARQEQQVLELQLLLEGAGLGVSLSQEHTGRSRSCLARGDRAGMPQQPLPATPEGCQPLAAAASITDLLGIQEALSSDLGAVQQLMTPGDTVRVEGASPSPCRQTTPPLLPGNSPWTGGKPDRHRREESLVAADLWAKTPEGAPSASVMEDSGPHAAAPAAIQEVQQIALTPAWTPTGAHVDAPGSELLLTRQRRAVSEGSAGLAEMHLAEGSSSPGDMAKRLARAMVKILHLQRRCSAAEDELQVAQGQHYELATKQRAMLERMQSVLMDNEALRHLAKQRETELLAAQQELDLLRGDLQSQRHLQGSQEEALRGETTRLSQQLDKDRAESAEELLQARHEVKVLLAKLKKERDMVEQLRGTVTGLTAKLEASGSLSSRAAEVQVLLEKERARSAELSDVGQGAAEKLRALEEELAASRHVAEDLQTERSLLMVRLEAVPELKQRLEQARASSADASAKVQENAALKRHIEALEADRAEKEATHNAVKTKLTSLEAVHSTHVADAEQLRARLEARVSKAEEQLACAEEKKVKLQEEVADLMETLRATADQLQEARGAEQGLIAAEARAEAHADHLQMLQDSNSALRSERDGLQAKLSVLDDLRSKLRQLESEHSALQAHAASFEAEKEAAAKSASSAMQEQLSAMRNARDRALAEKESHRASLEALTERKAAMEFDLAALKKSLAAHEEEAESAACKAESFAQQLEAAVQSEGRLKEELVELRQRAAVLEVNAGQCTALKEEVKLLRAELHREAQAGQQMTELRSQVALLEHQRDSFKAQLEAAERASKDAPGCQRAEAPDPLLSQMRADLAEERQRIDALIEERARLTAQLEVCRQQLGDSRAAEQRLRQEAERASERASLLEREKAQHEGEAARLSSDLRALERRHQAQAAASAPREQLDAATARVESLAAELAEAEARCENSAALVGRLRAERDGSGKAAEAARAEAARLGLAVQAADVSVEELRRECQQAWAARDAAMEECEALSREAAALREEAAAAREASSTLSAQLDDTAGRLRKVTEGVAASAAEAQAQAKQLAREELEELRARASALESALEESAGRAKAARGSAHVAEAARAKLAKEVEGLRGRVCQLEEQLELRGEQVTEVAGIATQSARELQEAQQQLAEEGERVEALLRESEALRRELSEVRELTEGAQLRLAAVSTERDEAEAGSRRDRQRANDLESANALLQARVKRLEDAALAAAQANSAAVASMTSTSPGSLLMLDGVAAAGSPTRSPSGGGHVASPPGSLFYNPFFTPLAQRNTRGGLLFATPPSALLGEASKVVELMASRAAAGESAERGAGVSRAEVSQLQQCLESSMKGAEHLQAGAAAAEERVMSVEAEIAALQQRCAGLDARAGQAVAQLEEAQARAAAEVQRRTLDNEALQASARESKARAASLQAELESAAEQRADLEQAQDAALAELRKQTSLAKKRQVAIAALQAEIQTQRKQLGEAEAACHALSDQLEAVAERAESAGGERDELAMELEGAMRRQQELAAALATKEEEVARVSAERLALEVQLAEAEAGRRGEHVPVACDEGAAGRLQAEAVALRARCRELQETNDSLKEEAHKGLEMAEVLAGMSPLLQAQLDDLATAQRMEEENAQLRAALDAATATVQRLADAHGDAQSGEEGDQPGGAQLPSEQGNVAAEERPRRALLPVATSAVALPGSPGVNSTRQLDPPATPPLSRQLSSSSAFDEDILQRLRSQLDRLSDRGVGPPSTPRGKAAERRATYLRAVERLQCLRDENGHLWSNLANQTAAAKTLASRADVDGARIKALEEERAVLLQRLEDANGERSSLASRMNDAQSVVSQLHRAVKRLGEENVQLLERLKQVQAEAEAALAPAPPPPAPPSPAGGKSKPPRSPRSHDTGDQLMAALAAAASEAELSRLGEELTAMKAIAGCIASLAAPGGGDAERARLAELLQAQCGMLKAEGLLAPLSALLGGHGGSAGEEAAENAATNSAIEDGGDAAEADAAAEGRTPPELSAPTEAELQAQGALPQRLAGARPAQMWAWLQALHTLLRESQERDALLGELVRDKAAAREELGAARARWETKKAALESKVIKLGRLLQKVVAAQQAERRGQKAEEAEADADAEVGTTADISLPSLELSAELSMEAMAGAPEAGGWLPEGAGAIQQQQQQPQPPPPRNPAEVALTLRPLLPVSPPPPLWHPPPPPQQLHLANGGPPQPQHGVAPPWVQSWGAQAVLSEADPGTAPPGPQPPAASLPEAGTEGPPGAQGARSAAGPQPRRARRKAVALSRAVGGKLEGSAEASRGGPDSRVVLHRLQRMVAEQMAGMGSDTTAATSPRSKRSSVAMPSPSSSTRASPRRGAAAALARRARPAAKHHPPAAPQAEGKARGVAKARARASSADDAGAGTPPASRLQRAGRKPE
eukprot:jgi/Tetstr1/463933/TSEL_008739.t2